MGCKIDDNLAPLSEPLQSGQKVQIITDAGAYPSPNWLNFVVTGRARSAIRHFLTHQHRGESIHQGKYALDKALRSLGSRLDNLDQDTINAMLEKYNADSFDDILHSIGVGQRTAIITAHVLVSTQPDSLEIDRNLLRETLTIYGNEGTVVSYAHCCNPIPGDAIVAKINSAKGVVIHRNRCSEVLSTPPNGTQIIDLRWAEHTQGEFSVAVRVTASNRRGIYARIASAITSLHADIEHIKTNEVDANFTHMDLVIDVHDRIHLAKILRHIRTIPGVEKVLRINK